MDWGILLLCLLGTGTCFLAFISILEARQEKAAARRALFEQEESSMVIEQRHYAVS